MLRGKSVNLRLLRCPLSRGGEWDGWCRKNEWVYLNSKRTISVAPGMQRPRRPSSSRAAAADGFNGKHNLEFVRSRGSSAAAAADRIKLARRNVRSFVRPAAARRLPRCRSRSRRGR